jgi:hypothetical protein
MTLWQNSDTIDASTCCGAAGERSPRRLSSAAESRRPRYTGSYPIAVRESPNARRHKDFCSGVISAA